MRLTVFRWSPKSHLPTLDTQSIPQNSPLTVFREQRPNSEISLDEAPWYKKLLFKQFSKVIEAGKTEPYKFNMLFKVMDNILYSDYPNFERFFEKNVERLNRNVMKIAIAYVSPIIKWQFIMIFIK